MAEQLQIKFEFNTGEDRLLLRIAEREKTDSCVEHRLWLTRRFVHLLIKTTEKIIEDELASNVLVSPDAMEAMKRFQHEAALSKADFSTSYNADPENCTLSGEKPVLVTTLKIRKISKGKYTLSLVNNENTGIHLTTGMDLVHSLQKMLLDSVRNAAWNEPLFRETREDPKTFDSAGYVS